MTEVEKPVLLLNDLFEEYLARGHTPHELANVFGDALAKKAELEIEQNGISEIRLRVTAEQGHDGRWTATARDPRVPSFPEIVATCDTEREAREQVASYVRNLIGQGVALEQRRRVDERLRRGRQKR